MIDMDLLKVEVSHAMLSVLQQASFLSLSHFDKVLMMNPGSGHTTLVSAACNRNLEKCGRDNGLDRYINKNRSFANEIVPPRCMSATVEALIGAMFLDTGESLKTVKVATRGLGLL